MMSNQCFLMNFNMMADHNTSSSELKLLPPKEKVMSYEEKTVGSTQFFKCEACPYMALAEDDIKFHLFTVHPVLAKTNGLADNVQIPCPGCSSVFDAEETLRNHLRNHHKMGIKDVKKMIKSLVQIALKDAKLKKEDLNPMPPPPPTTPAHVRQDAADIKIPQVIEIGPDIVNANNDLPKGVAYISVDELQKMSMPNFEQVDPKEIIQEASINIVYTNDISTQYISVSQAGSSNSCHSIIQVPSVPPDLISSIQPHATSLHAKLPMLKPKDVQPSHIPLPCKPENSNEQPEPKTVENKGTMCNSNGCRIYLKEAKNLDYHKRCHEGDKMVCPECNQIFAAVDHVHTHLWKIHGVDLELPTCDICGFKTYNRHRLQNIHMKCHKDAKDYICSVCSKGFKNSNQLSKHKLIHNKGKFKCSICTRDFQNERRLRVHVDEVHEKIKPFKCVHCKYSSSRKELLRLHLRTHTGDKPYACDQCEFKSSDHNSLRRHKKQHSKENVYQCKYCPYTAIQSTVFASHMISRHPNVENPVHRCPYCAFKSINKDKYILHLTRHTDKEGIQLLIEMSKNAQSTNKCNWTIPSETKETSSEVAASNDDEKNDDSVKTVNEIPYEVYDCDSLSEPQNYSKGYCETTTIETQQTNFNSQVMVTDLSKDDNNSDCLISESSNDTVMERQYTPQHPLQMTYDTNQSNLHGFLNTSVSMGQNLLQTSNVSSLTTNHSIASSISKNIMSNFPIRLPPAPPISLRNNITLKHVDKISLPTTKVTGPIITPTQILPVPSSSNSPVNISIEAEGVPRKKPKISVKSNLILKGPDQVNMFHSQQKMAFRRLEDNQRFGLGGPVTFNNLITTQFMQLPPEPSLSESPSDIMSYPQETMLGEVATTPVDSELNSNPQIFSFNQQMSVNNMTMLPPPQKIQTNDPSYIKLEATIKQNTQSPSLERMCNANLLNNPAINREYKASPPLEDIHKNMSEIKNEVKSDSFYNIPLSNSSSNPPILDQYLIDNIIGEQYSAHMDLSGVVLQEISDEQNDVIEIDDNSDDNKLLPRLDMFFPLESLYPMHTDFHFLENEIPSNGIGNEVVSEVVNRMVPEVPIVSQKELLDGTSEVSVNDFPNCIQGKKDPMMNTSVRPTTNKINVKNIELMKN